jgi:hypothetical protein
LFVTNTNTAAISSGQEVASGYRAQLDAVNNQRNQVTPLNEKARRMTTKNDLGF